LTWAASTALLHVTDMSYKRVNHPSEVIAIGDTVRVQIVRINHDTQRISLGMATGIGSVGWRCRQVPGRRQAAITNITEYGAFGVELEPGIDLVHVSEMLDQEERHPGKIVSTSQEVDVLVLEVDLTSAASLGLEAGPAEPWEGCRASPRWLDRRGRSQERHRIRPVHRPGWRRGRPMVMSDIAWASRVRRAGAAPQGEVVRPSCLTSTSRRSASRSA
jgi:predicted RNA-binding protein with RPS1 domain